MSGKHDMGIPPWYVDSPVSRRFWLFRGSPPPSWQSTWKLANEVITLDSSDAMVLVGPQGSIDILHLWRLITPQFSEGTSIVLLEWYIPVMPSIHNKTHCLQKNSNHPSVHPYACNPYISHCTSLMHGGVVSDSYIHFKVWDHELHEW
jgi:hypothetical protein